MKIKDLISVCCQSQAIVIFDRNGDKIKDTYVMELLKDETKEEKKFLDYEIDLIEPIEIKFKNGNKCYGLKIDLK